MRKIFAWLLVVVFVGGVGLAFWSGGVFAKTDGTNVYVLGDKPKRIEGFMDPGDSYASEIEVLNSNDERVTVTVTPRPYSFELSGREYLPNFTSQSGRTEFSKWIVFPEGEEYKIEPGETKKIGYEFTVPQGALSGSQAAAILVHTVTGTEGQAVDKNIAAESSYGYIIHVNINGDDIKEEGKVLSWETDGLTFNPVIRTFSLIENTGNVSFTSNYKLQVMDMIRGNKLVYETDKNADVLAESKRTVTHNWDKAPRLGIFKVKQTVTYLKETEEFSKTVIICPLWLIILVALLIVFAVVAIVGPRRKRKA